MLLPRQSRYLRYLRHALGLCALLVGPFAAAQNAPGEDPVRIDSKVVIQGLPFGTAPRSGYVNPSADIPAWQKARIARYEAKAFSGNRGDILTEKDVINSVNTNASSTVCTQSIGSVNVAPGINPGAGFKPAPQVVVLRGDLVNICN